VKGRSSARTENFRTGRASAVGDRKKKRKPTDGEQIHREKCAHTIVAGLWQTHRCVAESYRARTIRPMDGAAACHLLATAHAGCVRRRRHAREHKLGNQQCGRRQGRRSREFADADGSIHICMELSYMQLHGRKRFFIGGSGVKNWLHKLGVHVGVDLCFLFIRGKF
jgi:hypothetical protein